MTFLAGVLFGWFLFETVKNVAKAFQLRQAAFVRDAIVSIAVMFLCVGTVFNSG